MVLRYKKVKEEAMHRNNLRKLLEKYAPIDANEIMDKTRMLDFLDTYEDCFERFCKIGHFTGSCWLINSDGTKFLLTLHRKIGLWLQLGGHADGDNDLARVALREAYEESGLKHIELVSADIFDIGVHLVSTYKNIPAHYHYDVRFLLRASDENIKISDESDDLQWFSVPPNENIGTDVFRMLEKYKEHQSRRKSA